MTTESNMFKNKYTNTLKHAQEINEENNQIQIEIEKIKEKNRIIEEYQNKVEQLQKQLQTKQEEIDISKKQLKRTAEVLEAEEGKWECLLSAKEEEISKLQDMIDKNKGNIAIIEEQKIIKAKLDLQLQEESHKFKKLKGDNENLIIEKEEIKKYAELLAAKLKKKDADSIFLVIV